MPDKILLIDDQPQYCEGIASLLFYSNKKKIEVESVCSLQNAYQLIYNKPENDNFDLISFDMSMPPYLEQNLKSGGDLAKLVRRDFPKIKILISSGMLDFVDFIDLTETINPEGLISKSDVSSDEIIQSFEQILDGNFYRSKLMIDYQKLNIEKSPLSDPTNLKIIKMLSKGFGINSISKLSFTGISAVKKRKIIIKQSLGIESGNDEDIIAEAIKQKIINDY